MATEPKLLCLDEPAAGFNPAEKAQLMDLIREIRDQGYTVLLIEHDMRLVMGVTDRIVVLEFGRKIAEGTPGRDPRQPGGHRRLPGSGRRRCFLRSRACASTTGTSRPSATSRFSVEEGEIVTLIGANGAGKTTTLKTISGPAQGARRARIMFDGKDITDAAAVRAGRAAASASRPRGAASSPA